MADATPGFDAIVIGAGVSGMYQLIKLRQIGMSAIVLEAGDGVGGTWYWNRYPGARFDSESYTYSYSFDPDLLREWRWTEHFSPQPETLRYLQHVAERFDLERDIRFDTRVARCVWSDEARTWRVEAEDGFVATGRFLITAIGALSAPVMPAIGGIDDFEGEAWHTARWPHEPVTFEDRRIGIIGTGATGVQVIQEVAKTAGHLTVFQRRPNWCAPLHNGPITDEEWAEIQERQMSILADCDNSYGGFIHDSHALRTTDVTDEEREAFYQELYDGKGFGIWFGNYRDVLVDSDANETISRFVAQKIRERVTDPAVAEKLIPTDHGFGTRRVPMETGYYEVYNQPNVRLVDVAADPIERITPAGVLTTAEEHELDLLIYATGFDAVTGAFDRMRFEGVGGVTLADTWSPEPRTYLGMQTPGFPNMFTLVGPHNVSTFCNMPRCIEQNVEWVGDTLAHMQAEGLTRVEPREEAVSDWTQHAFEMADRLLMSRVDSWFNGQNANLGATARRTLLYAGGLPRYRAACDDETTKGYPGFIFE